jgi:hypothetical protein
MSLETRIAVQQWAPSYRKATWVGALLIGAVVPVTFIASIYLATLPGR